MKARYHLLAIFAICALVAPGIFAQGPTPGNQIPGRGNDITSRIYTNAVLRTPTGESIGKAKTASIQSESRGLIQGLRLQVTGLTPGAEYALVIDSTLVGTATANSRGFLRMKFITPSAGRVAALPEAITPISTVQVVQLYAVVGQQLVATGDFFGNSTPGPR